MSAVVIHYAFNAFFLTACVGHLSWNVQLNAHIFNHIFYLVACLTPEINTITWLYFSRSVHTMPVLIYF